VAGAPLRRLLAHANGSLMTDIPQTARRAAPRISFVSLGCPQALVDSERILTRLRAEGYELARNHAGADAVIAETFGKASRIASGSAPMQPVTIT
jgi:hypothetical protein